MDLRRVSMFVAVAEELNFTRAAERLAIAQPPLSQHIRRLEEELGVQLFSRTSRKVELTAAGHQLLRGARELLGKRAEVINLTRRAAGGEVGVHRFAVGSSAAFGLVAEVLRDFGARYPAVSVQLDERESEPIASALITGELDVAILRGPFSHAELTVELLLREPLEVVLPSHHRLAGAEEVPLSELAGEPMILFSRDRAPELHDMITSLCVAAGFSPRMGQEGQSWASVVGLVGAGLGITIAPASAALIKSRHVVFRKISRLHGEAELVIAYRRESVPPVGEQFVAVAKEVLRRWGERGDIPSPSADTAGR